MLLNIFDVIKKHYEKEYVKPRIDKMKAEMDKEKKLTKQQKIK